MQEVARFADVYEAEVAASFLAAYGVRAFVAERTIATMNPVMQTAVGGVRLLVPHDEAGSARELLGRARRGEFAGAADDDEPQPPRGRVFPLVTALAGIVVGNGFSGPAFTRPRGQLSAVHLGGLILIGAFLAIWLAFWLVMMFALG